MKTSALILGLAIISIASSTLFQSNPDENSRCNIEMTHAQASTHKSSTEIPDFFFQLGHRYNRTATKSELISKSTIQEFCQLQNCKEYQHFSDLTVTLLDRENRPSVTGSSGEFSKQHRTLIELANDSENILITAAFQRINLHRQGYFHHDTLVYYTTIVPSTQARYSGGNETAERWLSEALQKETHMLDPQKISAGKVHFTIDVSGQIGLLNLESSCGYSEVDEAVMDAIQRIPGKWSPAKNAQGLPVPQTFVFSFGQGGC